MTPSRLTEGNTLLSPGGTWHTYSVHVPLKRLTDSASWFTMFERLHSQLLMVEFPNKITRSDRGGGVVTLGFSAFPSPKTGALLPSPSYCHFPSYVHRHLHGRAFSHRMKA